MTNYNFNTKHLRVAALTLLMTLSPFALGFYYTEHSTKDTLDDNLDKQDELLTDQIRTQKDQYIEAITENTKVIVEAVRAATAQEAISTAQIAKADKNARQVLTQAMLADEQVDDAIKTMLRFGPDTGQGYAACKVMAENQQTAQVMDTVPKQTERKVDAIDTSPNNVAKSKITAASKRRLVHKQNFCTDAEAEMGQCKAASPEMQGADSNAATLFVSAKSDSDVAVAKQAVRQNILGTPTIAIPPQVANTARGKAYLYAVNRKTALSAFPAYSLAYLESMSEVREDLKDSDGNPLSPNDLLFNTVTRYYGGKDAAEWQASMIKQQPRGLLVEMAKMEGLGGWMDYQEMLALQRMEGNLAALTLTSTLPMEDKLRKQKMRVDRKAVLDNRQ